MPKVRNPSIRPHFYPLVLRAEFSQERLYTGPLLTMRRVFDPEPNVMVNPQEPVCHVVVTPSEPTDLIPKPNGVVTPSEPTDLIPKPNGEVTRIARNGYNLHQAVGWEYDFYNEVQVRQSTL
jgi:hypothetical protein